MEEINPRNNPFPRPPTTPNNPPGDFVVVGETRNDGYNVNRRIMVTAFVSLVFVIVLVLVLHLYARYLLRRQQAARRATTISIYSAAAATATQTPAPAAMGLDPSAIGRLPKYRYSSSNESSSASECAVCLSAFEEGERLRLLPSCKHEFHVECIDMWLFSHSTCPVCRAGVESVKEKGEASGGNIGSEGAVSRLSSSFRRMMSRERSGRRVHDAAVEDDDIERQ